MPERQLALTGRPEISFSGRGYKAANMDTDGAVKQELPDKLASITLCDLAYAYCLQYKQCRSIAKRLPVQFPNAVTSLAELDALAAAAAQTKNCLELLLDEVLDRIIKVTQIIRPDIYLHYIQTKVLFWGANDLSPVLEEVFRAYFLGVARVNKKEAVLLLHENGFALVNPFMELSREYVATVAGDARKRINIPPALFAGKDIYAAYDTLKEIYPDMRVMAAILQKVGGNKIDIGRILYDEPDRNKNTGKVPNKATYWRTCNRLLAECEANFIITFVEET